LCAINTVANTIEMNGRLKKDEDTDSSYMKLLDESGGSSNKGSFRTPFPAPSNSRPFIAPSLYLDDTSVYNSNKYTSSHRRSHNRPSSGLVFRNADSTLKAMNELTQKRHETMERRRASILLIGLIAFAWGLHHTTNIFVSKDENRIKDQLNNIDMAPPAEVSEEDSLDKKKETEAVADTTEPKERRPVEPEIIPPGKEFLLPLQYFAEVTTPLRPEDVNFFFHIPRSAGQTIKEIVGKCLGKTLASEVGVRDGHGQDLILQKVQINNANYVNVDSTSVDGLHRAATLGLAESQLADMVSSSYFHEASMLFDAEYKGRAFTVFRNPIERITSMYYDRTQGENADLDVSMEDYAQGNGIENNWVTRFLTNKMEGELTKEHLDQAKDILSTKFLIGLIDDGDETVKRVMKYFNWSFDPDETRQMEQEDCIKELIKDGTNVNTIGYDLPKKGSQPYSLITWQTQFDIKLYDYAKELFEKQTKLWGSKERKKELKKKKRGNN